MPMERAVPRTLLMAASTEAAFRSGIFCLAISSTCFSVTLPTLSLLGAPDPLAMPAARFNNTDAGGVLVMKVKVRSLYTVITTGTIRPSSSFGEVRALNCLQNSMILSCAWPSAGPTGGAGVAFPAAICNFTNPVTFFAMIPSRTSNADCQFPIADRVPENRRLEIENALRHFLHLVKLQLHRSRAAKNCDHHLHRLAILIHFVDQTGEGGERSFRDAYRFVLFELDLQLGFLTAVRDFVNDVLHFLVR